MATRTWLGTAAAVAQVSTVQVTAYDAATTYSLTINNNTISVIAAGSVNATATALAAAWNTSTIPEFAEVTAAANTDTVTLTGDLAGRPFTVVSADTDGTGTIGSVTAVTAATGPNHWSNTANWTAATVPITGDTVIIDGPISILYGLDQSAVTLAELRIMQRFTGYIGVPKRHANNYAEYRDDFLKVSATLLKVGIAQGSGSGRIKVNLGSVASTITVDGTGTSAERDLPACILAGSSTSDAITVNGGSVGVGLFGETCSLQGGLTQNGGFLATGAAVTLGAVVRTAGTLISSGSITTSSTIWLK